MTRLIQVKNNEDLIKQWALQPELAEFFRRCPNPAMWQDGLWSSCYYIEHDETIVGLVTLTNIETVNKQLELGLLVLPIENKRIVYMQALAQIASYLFEYLDYHKVYSKILVHRAGLIKHCIDSGFELEGKLKDSVRWNNAFHSEVLLAIFKDTWIKRWRQS